MKDCKKIHPLLALYLDQGLPPREASRVEAHLKGCPEAQKELEGLQRLRGVLTGLPEPKIPSDLHDKIMSRLRGGIQPLPARRFWVIPTWTLAAAAVLAVFFINQYPQWREQIMAPPAVKPKVETNPPNPFPATSEKEKKDVSQAPRPGGYEAPEKKEAKAVSHHFAKRKEAALKPAGDISTQGLVKQEEAPPAAKANLDVVSANKTSAAAHAPARGTEESGAGANMQAGYSSAAPAAAPAAQPAPAMPSVQEGFKSVTYSREMPVLSWNGNHSPVTVEQAQAVTDAQAFQELWQGVNPNQPLPTVDFTRQAVVALMAGQEPSSGYSIQVSRLEEKADQLVIHYRVEAPSANTVANAVSTSPWAMQVIEKPSKPVVFQRDP